MTSRTKRRPRRILESLVPGLGALCLQVAATPTLAQSAQGHPDWPGKGQLFVGACYQPVDRSPEQIHRDIGLMKRAGFTMVRMGDLSWDAFEPSEGHFEFAWFDKILDEMQANGIKVILDISGLPAPMWLHHAYPGVNIVNKDGAAQQPATRYMEDISDPDYRRLAARLADELTRRYAKHPALIAVGYDNEIGNGFMSYSAADRLRFIEWLKARYGGLDALNTAWQTQRWSRKLSSWDEVSLPSEDGMGPMERHLDLRRFWSDETVNALKELESIRKKNAPNLPAVSNLYDTSARKGFDYLSTYKDYVTYGAMGFYPTEAVSSSLDARMVKGDLDTPIWFNEFTAGGPGDYGVKGRSRMWAYMGLLNGAQTFLAWTFNSHLGGEEQALFGLLDHDDTPSWKLDEFARIAAEFKTLQKEGFPRLDKPPVAIAYSFDSRMVDTAPQSTVRDYIKTAYLRQVNQAFEPFDRDNIDTAIINIGHAKLAPYKLVVVAGDYIMDAASAAALRAYVHGGGTVIMTAYSAKADENGNWFSTPLPGRLSDVFGVTTNAFYTSDTALEIPIGAETVRSTINRYEILKPTTATVLARFENVDEKPPAITVNRYGKGRAIYLATPAQSAVLGPLARSLYAELSLKAGPVTPPGVYARVVEGRTLYVNSTTQPRDVQIKGEHRGQLTGARYNDVVHLDPYGVDLVE